MDLIKMCFFLRAGVLQNQSSSGLRIRSDTAFTGHFGAWVQKSSSHLPVLFQGPLHDQVSAVPIAVVCRLASLAAIPCNNIRKQTLDKIWEQGLAQLCSCDLILFALVSQSASCPAACLSHSLVLWFRSNELSFCLYSLRYTDIPGKQPGALKNTNQLGEGQFWKGKGEEETLSIG